jgi:hypothetical protein
MPQKLIEYEEHNFSHFDFDLMSTTHGQQRHDEEDGDDGAYEPSPYPLSILPRVRHGKSRPSLVRAADVPPTPLPPPPPTTPTTTARDKDNDDGAPRRCRRQ